MSAPQILSSGRIAANGGDACEYYNTIAGAGSGGRIRVDTKLMDPSIAVSAYGGNNIKCSATFRA